MINNDAEVVASTNLFTEFELTDEQLESISGGFEHDNHRGHDEHNDHDNHGKWYPRKRHGYWDRWHHWH